MSKCNNDCFNCPYDDCINEENLADKQSDEFDLDVRLAKKMARAKTREQRYGATRKGYAVRMKALRKYEKNHPEKTALWSFKSRIRREKGYDPSEEECRAFLIRRGYLKEEVV